MESIFRFPNISISNEQTTAFSGLAAWSPITVHLKIGGLTERLDGEMVSTNYNEVLGVEPIVGRDFHPDEGEVPGRHPVAPISARLWRVSFHSSTDVVGKTAKLNGQVFTLVGSHAGAFQRPLVETYRHLGAVDDATPGSAESLEF